MYKNRFQTLLSNEEENIYNIIQAHREAVERHVLHTPRNKQSLWAHKKVVEKRGALQEVLKGTSEEARLKAPEVEDAKKDVNGA